MTKALKIIVLAALMGTITGPAVEIVWIPLSLSGSNVFVATNAYWWTNSTPLTNVETWQAWWAVRENFSRLTNAIATNPPSGSAAGLSNATLALFPTTNTASPGGALRWD